MTGTPQPGAAQAEIATALRDYFDGIYTGDVDRLAHVFHPNARLYSATEGPLVDMSLADYLELVAGREAPAASSQRRYDRVVAIDQSGPDTALAKVELGIPPKYFTDYLSLLRIDGRWRIISKTFHFVVHA